MADCVDCLNFVRLFFAEVLHPVGVDLRRAEQVWTIFPEATVITDCKSLYDALEKNEPSGLGLFWKRTAIEVQAIEQQMQATGSHARWVNSDRQLADVFPKPNT